MELRGQDQDMGIPIGYSTTTTTAVTGRRRNDHHQSTVLNPTQKTLDHHLHLHQQLNLHQQTHVVGRDPNPDPDPDPTPSPSPSPSPTIARASNSKTPPPPQPPPPSLEANSGSSASFRYRECLKNHAANMGCHVVDGCGEFMPSGEEGTPEELKCAACDCHRNFHRKEIEGESQQPGTNSYYPYNPNRNTTHRTTTTTHLPPPLPPPPPHHHHHHHRYAPPTGPIQPVMMAFGGGVAAESSSDGLNNMVFHCNDGTQPPMGIVQQPFTGSKKRFRTKFSQEQKDRMQEFAKRLEWKIQKQDEEQVQQFCGEVGVKRQVFKVWMHNNKQAMKKKQL